MAQTSLRDILDHYSLVTQDLTKECPREIRIKIALKLKDWKVFGNILLIPKEILASIDAGNRTEDQKKIALFDSWHEVESKDATSLRLAEKLCEHNRRDLVCYLCELIQSHTKPKESKVLDVQADCVGMILVHLSLNMKHFRGLCGRPTA